MNYTTEKLNDLNRKEVYEVARAIATDKGITGISKYPKDKLIEFIMTNQTIEKPAQTEVEEQTQDEQPIEFESVPTPEEFFNQVSQLDNRLKVNQACNSLLDLLSEKFTVATVSKKLSAYKKLFYSFQHPNNKLNETVDTSKGKNTQHIAANLLSLTEEQSTQLKGNRQQAESFRLGIKEDGDIKDVVMPPQNIKSIVEKACSLLTSTNPVDIACGLLPLTGLRRNEQNMPAIEYESGVIEREWKVIGEFLIAIKGLSKKGGNNDWFARATLAPAQMIVDAQKRFLAHPKVKAIPSNYQAYSDGAFRKAVDRRFKEIWSKEFLTIEAYDDNGKKVKNNASTHKARAFYTWALVPVLKANGFNQKQAKLYVKECLGHDDEKDTSKYFNRYDEDQFIEAIDINIPTNFKEIGQITSATVEELNKPLEVKETEDKSTLKKQLNVSQIFDLNKFVDSIPEDLQIKFINSIKNNITLTDSLIEIVNTARNTQPQTETKPPVSDKISEILTAVMEYNGEQAEVKNILVPTYAACNRISKVIYDKEIARSTFDDVWGEYGRDITERLANRDIPNISRDEAKRQGLVSQEMHNGKYHRKDMDEVVSKIVSILEYQ
ncbi:MAG: protelomerase family protein [Cyanobacteria bacterium P01_D01_bin.116]